MINYDGVSIGVPIMSEKEKGLVLPCVSIGPKTQLVSHVRRVKVSHLFPPATNTSTAARVLHSVLPPRRSTTPQAEPRVPILLRVCVHYRLRLLQLRRRQQPRRSPARSCVPLISLTASTIRQPCARVTSGKLTITSGSPSSSSAAPPTRCCTRAATP
jgi:hypothetical protein